MSPLRSSDTRACKQVLNRRKILTVSTQLKQLRKESLKKNSGLKGIRTHDLCGAAAGFLKWKRMVDKLWWYIYIYPPSSSKLEPR